MHAAYVMIGSNIRPVENTRLAVTLLSQETQIQAISTSWETQSIGFDGPNFINTMVFLRCEQDEPTLNMDVLKPIEQKLGRVRTSDKNAPRTMDLDIILFDDLVIDDALWRRAHLALPASDLIPELIHPETGQTLKEVAKILQDAVFAVPRPELDFSTDILKAS
jgi:2-amino-4-hydroxy-6-hydroxymethyldihydropteridine diphosphokinase